MFFDIADSRLFIFIEEIFACGFAVYGLHLQFNQLINYTLQNIA